MAVKRIVAPRPQAPVLALAVPSYAGKRTTTEAAPRRFARGSAVDVRHRLARAPRSGRWMTIFVRATVVDSAAASGANDDDCYIVRNPACSETASGGRMACVPAADVREARRTPTTAADKRPSPESSTETADGASCKKAKRTGQGIPMDALLRFLEEHEKAKKKEQEHVRREAAAGEDHDD